MKRQVRENKKQGSRILLALIMTIVMLAVAASLAFALFFAGDSTGKLESTGASGKGSDVSEGSAVSDTEYNTETEPGTEADTRADVGMEANAGMITEADTGTDLGTEANTEVNTGTDTEADTETGREMETEMNTEVNTETETERDGKIYPAEESEAVLTQSTEPQTEAAAYEEEKEMIGRMKLEDKVAQLFVITPEALTGVGGVTMAGEATREAIDRYPVGGLVYFAANILSEEQCSEMTRNVQEYSMERTGLPMLICVDEEGGTVARISGRGFANVPDIPSMFSVGETGDCDRAYSTGDQIGTYLTRFGFNVDFAPVADIFSNDSNTVIGTRAFGKTADLVAQMTASLVGGLKSHGIACTLKHFPGHGDTLADSHYGAACSYKTLEELRKSEFVPFQAGIEAGADLVMAGHISLPNVLADDTPASLSYEMITGILRNELGFEGVVITDALNMGAVSNNYSSAAAAVSAIEAGVDLILMPADFQSAYAGVLDAVRQGTINEKRIDESLLRILILKRRLNGGLDENDENETAGFAR